MIGQVTPSPNNLLNSAAMNEKQAGRHNRNGKGSSVL
jgi:hypothetical protein